MKNTGSLIKSYVQLGLLVQILPKVMEDFIIKKISNTAGKLEVLCTN